MPKKGYEQTKEHTMKILKAKKGYKHSEETLRKMREVKLGEKNPHYGKRHSEEIKRRMGEKHKKWHQEVGLSKEKRLLMAKNRIGKYKGEKSSNWKGGITPINLKIRRSREYLLWCKSVLERDNYTCIWCGGKEKIEVDHIKPFADYPELRFAIDNGRTLCRRCHKKTDTYGNRRYSKNLKPAP